MESTVRAWLAASWGAFTVDVGTWGTSRDIAQANAGTCPGPWVIASTVLVIWSELLDDCKISGYSATTHG
jgi:hypothetical protein